MKNDKIKVIIVDDEEPARKLIANFLKDDYDFEIIDECADGFSAAKKINELQPDLVFLDIQMPKLTGLEVIELLDNIPFIVFVTAYDEFAVTAFELNALDYLLKPYSRKRFAETLEKVKDKFNKKIIPSEKYDDLAKSINRNKTTERIAVKTRSNIEVIPVEQIILFEAQDDYVQIYSEKAKYLKNMTMKYLESYLDKEIFMRVHRSYIININYIERIEKAEKDSHYIIMKNNIIAKASKSGYGLLKEKLDL
ncbi:MAG: response regulator [Bacteroidales bacterium]|nr:response regulator [Bacteroidales bacterium]